MACGRGEQKFVIDDFDLGKVNFRVIDRISPDDVVLHLVDRELHRIVNGEDAGVEINSSFVDFLVRDRFSFEA